jgi:hypothetical protein
VLAQLTERGNFSEKASLFIWLSARRQCTVGKMTLRFWKCGAANEEFQRLATWAGKFLQFDDLHPALPILHRVDE